MNPVKKHPGRIPSVLAILILAAGLAQCASQEPAAQEPTEPVSVFKTEKIAENSWRINDSNTVYVYLVQGEKHALLIDTGYGREDLAACVKDLTRLPVWVVNTHGHGDHAGGNKYFDTIFAHPADMAGVRFFSPGKDDITPVTDGYVFDLGGRKLTVIEAPGHTPGCICLLDAEHKLLFSGDDACPHVWLFLPESLPVETYIRTQEKLLERRAEFDIVYAAHGGPFKPVYLETLTILAKRIMNEECAKVMPYKSSGFTARSCFYNGALIAFDPDKLKDK